MSAPEVQFRQRMLAALEAAAARIEQLEQRQAEPIAIIGMGCRFPGNAADPQAFWQLLIEQRDAVGWPTDGRFGLADGRYQGGFLAGVDRFDAAFFGISPREAEVLDPQQRLLLETAWHAIEDAGVPRHQLRGSRTGVFVGITTSDYGRELARMPQGIDAYYVPGNMLNMAAGRLAYFFGLRGPSLVIDTACSSSLVALHSACQSLRLQECAAALVAGVNLVLSADGFVALGKTGVLAADGRCRSFDAAAAGIGRGEGCGVLVLKRLRDAQAAGDRIAAVIRGSAINQDGASAGLTVPNGLAQQEVIRDALAAAALTPSEVDYVEAHGTGTPLGDPIEAGALAAVFGSERSAAEPLVVGSVKGNIAHLEAAAGIASLIKTVLCLQHELIPPQVHFSTPSPHLRWEQLPLQMAGRRKHWRRSQRVRRAGVSSFGLSGTNAHVVLEEAPPLAAAPLCEAAPLCKAGPGVLVVSAACEPALRQLAADHARRLPLQSLESWPELCYAAAVHRDHQRQRAAVIAATPTAAAAELALIARGERGELGYCGVAPEGSVAAAFVFAGEGTQYAALAALCYQREAVFRGVIEECNAAAGCDLLRAAGTADETQAAQLARFAFELALAELLRSWGCTPAAVLGHGVGELAAACVAGVWCRADAVRVVSHWAQSPSVLSAAALGSCIAGVPLHLPAVPIISSVTGAAAAGEMATPEYWVRQRAAPVRFGAAMQAVRTRGITRCVAIGTDPLLREQGRATAGAGEVWIQTLEHGRDALQMLSCVQAQLYVAGFAPAWVTPSVASARRVDLPLYPFQRERYWLLPTPRAASGSVATRREQGTGGECAGQLYELEWSAVPAAGPAVSAGDWALIGAPAALAARFEHCLGHDERLLGVAAADDVQLLRQWVDRASKRPLDVLYVAASEVDAVHACTQVLAWLQALDSAALHAARLWVLTCGAQGEAQRVAPNHAALWGFGRVAALEHPHRWGGLIDLEPDAILDPALLRAQIRASRPRRELLWRAGTVRAPLLRVSSSAAGGARFAAQASYLITGGAGSLGLAVAEWMVQRGARCLVLTGRRAPRTPEALARIEALRRTAHEVQFIVADVGVQADVARLIERASGLAPLRGIVHAAGVVADGMLRGLTPARFAAVLGGKARGAQWLDAATRSLSLDCFVLFSSLASVFGSAGQAPYAAANAVLDAIAADRRRCGLPALAISWGPWSGAGMAMRLSSDARHALQARGVGFLQPEEALALLDRAWGHERAHLLAAKLDVPVLKARLGPQEHTLLDALLSEHQGASAGSGGQPAPSGAVALSEQQLRDYLQEALRTILRFEVGWRPADGATLPQQGVDSMMATEFRNRLMRDLAVDVPIASFLASATLDSLAAAVVRALTLRSLAGGAAPAPQTLEEMVL